MDTNIYQGHRIVLVRVFLQWLDIKCNELQYLIVEWKPSFSVDLLSIDMISKRNNYTVNVSLLWQHKSISDYSSLWVRLDQVPDVRLQLEWRLRHQVISRIDFYSSLAPGQFPMIKLGLVASEPELFKLNLVVKLYN